MIITISVYSACGAALARIPRRVNVRHADALAMWTEDKANNPDFYCYGCWAKTPRHRPWSGTKYLIRHWKCKFTYVFNTRSSLWWCKSVISWFHLSFIWFWYVSTWVYTGVGRRANTDSATRLFSHMSGDVGQNFIQIPDISRSFHIHVCCI